MPLAQPFAPDGRIRRAQRSRHAIIEAMFDLIGRGTLDPTAEQVSARAGVGIRTVFRLFTDMESVFAEMGARIQAEALPLLLGGRPEGGLEERARALVRQRAEFFERIAPYKRAGNLKRWRSPFLREGHARLTRVLHAELLRWLPEVRRAPAAVADALDLAASFEAWDRLRSEQRLGASRARAALERIVLALVDELSSETATTARAIPRRDNPPATSSTDTGAATARERSASRRRGAKENESR